MVKRDTAFMVHIPAKGKTVAEIPSQSVEYLSVNEGLLGDPTIGEPVVIITIRPDPQESFEVVNLAIPRTQADRLLADLMDLLLPFVLLVGVAAW
jgi:hypothetical protein